MLKPLAATSVAAGAAVAIAAASGLWAAPHETSHPSHAHPSVAAGCPKVILYFSRGSGQALDERESKGDERGLAEPGLALYESLSKAYGAENVGSLANPYPAVNVSLRVRRVYLPSVDRGVRSAERNVTDLARLCPGSALVLGGYSQGAQVVHGALARLDAGEGAHVIAAVLFGDPYFHDPENGVVAEPSTNPAPAFDRHRSGIAFSPLVRFPKLQPLDGAGTDKVFSWCHGLDPVCQGFEARHPFRQFKARTHYSYDLDVGAATSRIEQRLRGDGIYALPGGKTVEAGGYPVIDTCRGGTCAIAEWSGPGRASYRTVGALHEGQLLDIVCQVDNGEEVSGASGGPSAIWDELDNGAFVADYYVGTPEADVRTSGIPLCQGLSTGQP